jgi:integrase
MNIPAISGTNGRGLGESAKVIQQILRHADITTTMNIYVKSDMGEATAAMKTLEAKCATNVQPFTGEASSVM